MFIKSIKLKNFKCYSIEKEITFSVPNSTSRGLNILIGENNTGKSTIFEAFDFIRNGLPTGKNILDLLNRKDQDMYVEITFVGNIEKIIENYAQGNKLPVIKNCIHDEDGVKLLTIRRESNEPNKILLWRPTEKIFKNETGIDAPIKKLFELDFIWSDTNPEDITKFGSTTVCGRLISEILTSFKNEDNYKELIEAHNKVFNDENTGLKTRLKDISDKVENICKEQFGVADIKFHFDQLDISSFLKNTRIIVNDGNETYLEDKGSGMQRSIALALLQVYADNISKQREGDMEKPFYIFIDEPEICLHPLAQLKLVDAFKNIGKKRQIFFTTHSPYIFRDCCGENVGKFLFSKDFEIKDLSKQKIGKINWGPTWGEINYFAYNLPTIELHNELYGFLQEKESKFSESDIEQFFNSKGIQKTKDYIRCNNGSQGTPYKVTVCTYIRNLIHHPENTFNTRFSNQELKDSIDAMLSLL